MSLQFAVPSTVTIISSWATFWRLSQHFYHCCCSELFEDWEGTYRKHYFSLLDISIAITSWSLYQSHQKYWGRTQIGSKPFTTNPTSMGLLWSCLSVLSCQHLFPTKEHSRNFEMLMESWSRNSPLFVAKPSNLHKTTASFQEIRTPSSEPCLWVLTESEGCQHI